MATSQTDTLMPILSLQSRPEAVDCSDSSVVMTHLSRSTKPPPPIRKRSDTSEEGDEGGGKKRSRGRPRLETKDETAADRRRTQIRLAQRAYRNRKDSAIDTLKKRVRELEQVNEDMGREFMNFSDYVLGQGVMQGSPDVARRLNDATRKFLSLSRKATEDSGEEANLEDVVPDTVENTRESSKHRQNSLKQTSSETTSSSGEAQSTPNTEWSLEDPNLSGLQGLSDPFQQFNPLVHLPVNSITYPTMRDSSFPVLDSQAPVSLFSNSYTQSPFGTLPGPTSYAFQERSFGRRFQRATIEAGLSLALMENPPPDRYMAVFAFCLQFESRQEIIRRLSIVLDKTRSESLNNWRYPFTNLGGAGTWLPCPDSTGKISDKEETNNEMPIGNHGLPEPYRPSNITGFSTGPFSEDVELAKDIRLDHRMRMLHPGFEGDFFDADEVDAYLRKHGIVIPDGRDYIEVVIDLEVFDNPPSLPPRNFAPGGREFFKPMTVPGSGPDLMSLYSNSVDSTNNVWQGGPTANSTGISTIMNNHLTLPTLDPQFDSMGSELPSGTERPLEQALPSFEEMSEIPWRVWETPQPPPPTKTKVTIDVNRLVAELVAAAVCLGRTPGIRPKDVHKAVRLAIALQGN